jgi:hypothetical protein
MSKLLIGNDCSEDLVGAFGDVAADWSAQRIAWYMEDGDVLLLPVTPDYQFLRYVAHHTGTDYASLRVVVAGGDHGEDSRLNRARLRDERLLDELRKAVAAAGVESVLPLWPNAEVARLSRRLGLAAALPGIEFLEQNGEYTANSKVFFRTLAAGIGVPIARGYVAQSRETLIEQMTALFDDRCDIMLKRDLMGGGLGNEVITKDPGTTAKGAQAVVHVPDEAALREYVERRWDWLSDGGRQHIVVERFHPDARTVFHEFSITADAVVPEGNGELLFPSVGIGKLEGDQSGSEILPARGLDADTARQLVEGGAAIARALQSIGYRGNVSADAVITTDGQVLFTEMNSRLTSSTHAWASIGNRVVGRGYVRDRLLVDRIGWQIPSLDEAVARLTEAGLAYDHGSRRGVILSTAINPRKKRIMYCLVVEDYDEADKIEAQMFELFPQKQQG